MDDSYDSSVGINSRLRSVSPIGDATYDETHEADLSLSELSLNDNPSSSRAQPFSLLARPSQPPEPEPANFEPDVEEEAVGDETVQPVEDEEANARSVGRSREERLRHDLFVMRKLNADFAVYNNALSDTRTNTERIAEQLKQTNALLDKYVGILAKSEAATRLIFDERWHGAEDDEATLERIENEKAEKEQKAAEERILAERREKERIEREERERVEKEEKDRLESEKREKLAIRAGYGSVRGVRGTRASTRARGATVSRIGTGATTTTAQRGRPSSIPTTTTGSGGRVPRPTSSIPSTRSSTASTVRPGVR